MNILYNLNQDGNSLQVSVLEDIPAGDFKVPKGHDHVLIKNITDDIIECQVKLVKNADYVTTALYPGWNPELVVAIKNVPAKSLQYGN